MIKLDVWLGAIYWLRSIIWVSLYIILICMAVRATPCWQYLWLSVSHLTNQSFPSNLVNIGQTSDIETRYQPCPASLSHITAPALTGPGRLETAGTWCWGEPAWLEGWAPCWCLPVSPVSWCPPQHCSADWLTDWLRESSELYSAVQQCDHHILLTSHLHSAPSHCNSH